MPKNEAEALAIATAKRFSLLPLCRLQSLASLVQKAAKLNLPGAIVECGTCRGGSAALLAWAVKQAGVPRTVYAFDTYAGLPEAGEHDIRTGKEHRGKYPVGALAASVDHLRTVATQLQVLDIIKPVVGKFQDTLPVTQIPQIAVLHADGDYYDSTMCILQNYYDCVVPGGFLQIDDYGAWAGCRKALHDFERLRGLKFSLIVPPGDAGINPVDQRDTAVVIQKPLG